MNLETRAFLSTWTTRFGETTPRILFYAPEIAGQSWCAVEVPTQDLCLVLLTYDKDITTPLVAAAAFAAAEAASQAEVLALGELSASWSVQPTRTAVLSRCEAIRIPQALIGASGTVRDAVREIVRRALLFQEVGYPPAELSEPIGQNLTTFQARASARRFTAQRGVQPSTTVGTAYALLATSPQADYGLATGRAAFGHPEVHLGLGGLRR